MSPDRPLLRRLVAVLALVVAAGTLLGIPAGSASARDDTDLAVAAAAVEAAKADVELKKIANKEALARRDLVRERLARQTDALDAATEALSAAESALSRSRHRVAAARERLAAAQTPRARHNARRYLREMRKRATDARFAAVAASNAHAEAVAAVDRATAKLGEKQAILAGTRVALEDARAVLAAARQHYADLLELSSHQVVAAVANIPNRVGPANFASSMAALTAAQPDFITLNEISGRSLEAIQAAAPGYAVFRGGAALTDPGAAGQSTNNAVLWRTDAYQVVSQGRILVVDDDRGYHNGKRFLWDRYATWVTLRSLVDGQVTSVISTHMPTNPAKFPRQWGNPPMTRIQMYALGMDRITALASQLAAQGRVLVAGDMNSHPNQGAWAAAPKMSAAGYGFTKDRGVMYLFHSLAATVPSSRQLAISSDHPALVTTVQYS